METAMDTKAYPPGTQTSAAQTRRANPVTILLGASIFYLAAATIVAPAVGFILTAVAAAAYWGSTRHQGSLPHQGHPRPIRPAARRAMNITAIAEGVVFTAVGGICLAVGGLEWWPIAVAMTASVHLAAVGLAVRRLIDAVLVPLAVLASLAAIALACAGNPRTGCFVAGAALGTVTATYAIYLTWRELPARTSPAHH